MKNRTVTKILQIVPAPGWYVIYKDEPENVVNSLACWALVELQDGDDIFTYVAGMDAMDTVELCDSVSNFVGYQYGEKPQ